jgi:hypothetical protein
MRTAHDLKGNIGLNIDILSFSSDLYSFLLLVPACGLQHDLHSSPRNDELDQTKSESLIFLKTHSYPVLAGFFLAQSVYTCTFKG